MTTLTANGLYEGVARGSKLGVCPHCGSVAVRAAPQRSALLAFGDLLRPDHKYVYCEDCHHDWLTTAEEIERSRRALMDSDQPASTGRTTPPPPIAAPAEDELDARWARWAQRP